MRSEKQKACTIFAFFLAFFAAFAVKGLAGMQYHKA
jgi:hypothetical protein